MGVLCRKQSERNGCLLANIDNMQFRDFIFKHNPEKISVSDAQNVVTHFCPGKTEITQDMGKKARIVTCFGSFWGDSYSAAMRELLEFRQKSAGVGMLYLPGIPPFSARLSELSFDAQGDGRIIPYTMRFVEAAGE